MAQQDNYLTSYDDDESWEVIPTLREIGENLALMKKMVNSVGGSCDTSEERRKFLSLRSDVKSKLEQASSVISKMHNARPEIENELGHYVRQFRALLQTATYKFANAKPYDYKSVGADPESIPLLTNVNSTMSSSTKNWKQQLQTKMDVGEVTMHDDSKLLEEHTEKMNYIKEELSEMKDMFEQIDFLVESQQPEVDKLSQTVVSIKDDTLEGVKHLRKAATYAVTARRNRCLLLLFLLVVSFVMGAFIWTMNKRHDGGKG